MPDYDLTYEPASGGTGPTYSSIATWLAAGHSSASGAVFAYAFGSVAAPEGLHFSCDDQTSGDAPRARPPAGSYRIRVTGPGTTSAMNAGLTGPITDFRAGHGATNQCTIRIGTLAQYAATFANVPTSGVTWHLDSFSQDGGGTPASVEWQRSDGSDNKDGYRICSPVNPSNGAAAIWRRRTGLALGTERPLAYRTVGTNPYPDIAALAATPATTQVFTPVLTNVGTYTASNITAMAGTLNRGDYRVNATGRSIILGVGPEYRFIGSNIQFEVGGNYVYRAFRQSNNVYQLVSPNAIAVNGTDSSTARIRAISGGHFVIEIYNIESNLFPITSLALNITQSLEFQGSPIVEGYSGTLPGSKAFWRGGADESDFNPWQTAATFPVTRMHNIGPGNNVSVGLSARWDLDGNGHSGHIEFEVQTNRIGVESSVVNNYLNPLNIIPMNSGFLNTYLRVVIGGVAYIFVRYRNIEFSSTVSGSRVQIMHDIDHHPANVGLPFPINEGAITSLQILQGVTLP